MDLGVYNSDISSGILISVSVRMGPVGGLFLNEGPHEVVHDHELQVRLVQFIMWSTTFSIMSHQRILALDGLPSIKTLGSKVPLAPSAVPPKH